MTEAGHIRGIYRYPVKSMLGESLPASRVGRDGIPGDRAYGVRDEGRGDFFVGKRSAALMGCQARYAESPESTEVAEAARATQPAEGAELDAGVPIIELPSGERFAADAAEAAEKIGRLVGREVTLWPFGAEARDITPSSSADGSLLDEMQTLMARTPEEPMPDFSDPSPALREVYARGGPFFDAFPLSLISRQSIASLARARPESVMDVRRFRPSLLFDSVLPGAFPEHELVGRRVRIGRVVLEIQSKIVRCIMTTHGFAELPKDPRVMRTLVAETEGHLGVYATVEEPGEIRIDDRIELLA